jgi:hypothetical protein
MSSYKSSPYLNANRFSRYFHQYVFVFVKEKNTVEFVFDSWLSPLLKQSQQKCVLHLNDLYELPAYLQSTELTNKLESNWFDELKYHPNNPNLFRATLKTLGWKPFLYGFVVLLQVRKYRKLFHVYLRIIFLFSGNNTDYSTIITDIFNEIF